MAHIFGIRHANMFSVHFFLQKSEDLCALFPVESGYIIHQKSIKWSISWHDPLWPGKTNKTNEIISRKQLIEYSQPDFIALTMSNALPGLHNFLDYLPELRPYQPLPS